MNVNDGLLAIEKVFPSMVPRPDFDERHLAAQRLHLLAEYRDHPVQTIIRNADSLGLWVREDGLVYVR